MPLAPMEVRFIGGISLALTATFGLGCNLLLLIIFVKYVSSFGKAAFIIVTWQLIIGDLMVIIAQLIAAVPTSLTGEQVFGENAIPALIAMMDTIGFNCNMYFALALILNRFTIFCIPQINEWLFGRRSVYLTVSVFWLMITFRSIFTFVSGCWKTFEPDGFFFITQCPNDTNGFALYLHQSTKYESYVVPAVMFVLYATVLLRLHIGAKFRLTIPQMSLTKRSIEMRLLLQSIIICGSLQLETIAFSFFKKMGFEGNAYFYVNFFQNILTILNSSVHPIVLFVFNNDVRRGLACLVKSASVVQPYFVVVPSYAATSRLHS